MINPYKTAQKQILNVYDYLKKEKVNWEFVEEFLYPDRVIEVNITVKMDNGDIKVFTGYRSQHKNYKGPYKGGIRFHQNVTKDEVKALSIRMSVKTGVVNLPLGGGKGGIIVNPKELSLNELEQLSRGYVRQLYRYLGEDFDVPAPDVNTNQQIMAWMVDEYSKLVGKWSPGAFTGKPLALGGSKGRDIATALGGLYVIEKIFEENKLDFKNKTVAIQGAGNAGLNFAKLIVQKGAKIVAISDSKGGIVNYNGLNINEIEELKENKQPVGDLSNVDKVSNTELLELECDILVLAALENQITEENAQNIKAKYILELANGPTTPKADEILFKNNILVIPDILANAGGVTVSYFEQVQGNINYYWEEKEVFERLKAIMYQATKEVLNLSGKLNIDLRKASYTISLERQFNAWKYLK